jgi:hypothetical protein
MQVWHKSVDQLTAIYTFGLTQNAETGHEQHPLPAWQDGVCVKVQLIIAYSKILVDGIERFALA